jgi:hypothetical protein
MRVPGATNSNLLRMGSSGMLRRVAILITDFWKELIATILRGTSLGELGTTLAVTSNRSTLRSSSLGITSQRDSVASYS